MVYSAWHDLWENVPPGSYIVCWQSQGIALNMFSRHIYEWLHHVQALAIGVCTGGGFSQCELEHAGANFKRMSAEGWGGIDISTVVLLDDLMDMRAVFCACSEPLLTGTELLLNVVLGNWNIAYLTSTFHFSPSLQTPIRCCQLDCGTVDGEEWAPHGHIKLDK